MGYFSLLISVISVQNLQKEEWTLFWRDRVKTLYKELLEKQRGSHLLIHLLYKLSLY